MFSYWTTETYCNYIWSEAGRINKWNARTIKRKRKKVK